MEYITSVRQTAAGIVIISGIFRIYQWMIILYNDKMNLIHKFILIVNLYNDRKI